MHQQGPTMLDSLTRFTISSKDLYYFIYEDPLVIVRAPRRGGAMVIGPVDHHCQTERAR